MSLSAYPHAHEVHGSYQLSVAPVTEPVTLAEAKRQCRIDGSDEDADIERLITMARRHVEAITDRQLCSATWKLWLDRFPDCIELRKCPVQSVSNITYVDGSGDTQTLDSLNYRTDLVSEPARITPAFGEAWPTSQCVVNAVCVTFVSGYGAASAVDDLAKQAVLILVERNNQHRSDVLDSGKALEVPKVASQIIDLLRYDY